MPLSKREIARKTGLHIDAFIQLATQNGYACHFLHDGRDVVPPLDKRRLVVRVKDNLVTKIL